MGYPMIMSVDRAMFVDAFQKSDRMSNWSVEGLNVLYDYLIEAAEDMGDSFEFDVVGVDCDFTEYAPNEVLAEYPHLDLDENSSYEEIGMAINVESIALPFVKNAFGANPEKRFVVLNF